MKNKWLIMFIAFVMFGIPAIKGLLTLYPDYLWFKDLGYSLVFWKSTFSGYIFWAIATLIFFLFTWINITIARRVKRHKDNVEVIDNDNLFDKFKQQLGLNQDMDPVLKILQKPWVLIIILLVLAMGSASLFSLNWDKVYAFLNASIFNQQDPLFHQDIGFYFFKFPFFIMLKSYFTSMVVISIIGVSFFYLNRRNIKIVKWDIFVERHVKIHFTFLISLFLLLMAAGYQLNMYKLLYSRHGMIFGAGYTDIFATLFTLKVLLIISLIIVGLLGISIFARGVKLPLVGVLILVATMIILQGIYPGLVQQFIVKPNEITKEKPYILNNIEYTRKAYGLDKIVAQTYKLEHNPTAELLKRNSDALENTRLWDPRPLKQTFSQLQSIRLYYDFNDVDVDRYTIDGRYRQVMLAARELNTDQLPDRGQNWINRRLTYTHGYGITMIPVNSITPEGQPDFFLKNIPPEGVTDIQVTRPEIYYGEETNGYVIANTKNPEFDYPYGDNNKFTKYRGSTGIPISSMFRKLLFAIQFGEIKILLSEYIQKDSKILFYRNIMERVQKIAPFLRFDSDPYIIVSKGRLYWILDAYTVSDKYPYSDPFSKGNFNYIRNSVKVLVDAYNGTVKFYMVEKEPMIETYAKIFPGMFKPLSAVDPDILKHFRYPEDLFSVQAIKYGTYHMTDPVVFYNQEDMWVVPNETFDGNTQAMEPYHVLLRMQGEKKSTFRLMLPFSPSKKNNMIGWLSANSDWPNLGKMTVYKMPKDELIYGPMQIEAMIDQDTEISKQLTLWNQQGSRVIRGNLLVIPIENTFLYVEPIYLQATSSKFPELKRVVVAYNNKIVMEQDFRTALDRIFTGGGNWSSSAVAGGNSVKTDSTKPSMLTTKMLIEQANTYYQQAITAQRQGNWSDYGRYMDMIGKTIKTLKEGK